MKVLLTGANGYIGLRLLPVLIEEGHQVTCCVRDRNRLSMKKEYEDQVEIFEVDFLEEVDMSTAPTNFDVAYYLIHSMSSSGDFEKKEKESAQNFIDFIDQTEARQVVYLSGIVNSDKLSKHLRSRLAVEEILKNGRAHYTVLRAGIIVGSGSASFEIIRDLVEKLPVMIAPRWLETVCQPIAIRNVIIYLKRLIGNEECYDQVFDIGGPDILTYKQMLLQFAEVRGLRRYIGIVPVMTPKLSSYWLYFVTSTSYNLAINLVNSMKVDVVVQKGNIKEIIPQQLYTYRESVRMAFNKIDQNMVVSSWKDAMVNSKGIQNLRKYLEVPKHGVFTDVKHKEINKDVDRVTDNIFSIGGTRGWYYGNFLWKIRGFLDKLVGGVGLRRGRTHVRDIYEGDALDFWRVLVADREERRLLLYAEMKLPGEAWLEFSIEEKEDGTACLHQVATFRPNGLMGRLYWYSVLPFHYFVFNGMINRLQDFDPQFG